jgi:GT2 family glycosyltransferase
MNDALDLSVITVSWNSRGELPDCMRSVARSAGPMRFEHVLVDNASEDGGPDEVEREFPHVIVLRNSENEGFSRANNAAIARSRGRFVLFLNPDTEVLEDALPRLVQVMDENPDIGILGPKLLDATGRWNRDMGYRLPTLRTIANTYLGLSRLVPLPALFPGIVRSRDFHRLEDCGWVCGAALLIRREALERDRWNEEIFFFGEDMEFCRRVRQRGWRICSTPEARVVHFSGRSMSRQSSEFLSGRSSGISICLRESGGPAVAWLGLRLIRLGYALRSFRCRLSYMLGGDDSSLRKDLRLRQYSRLDRAGNTGKRP